MALAERAETMIKRSQIPYLVKLLDDESSEVRRHVRGRLLAALPMIRRSWDILEQDLTWDQLRLLRHVIGEHERTSLGRDAWVAWQAMEDDYQKLERGLELVGHFIYGWAPPVRLGELLDELAGGFQASGKANNAISLSQYLFQDVGLGGDRDDYYAPLNSCAVHAIERKTGLPITLCCIYILVGRRLGFSIHGCNVPGHFIARAGRGPNALLVDCFDEGRILSASEAERLRAALRPALTWVLSEPAQAEDIVTRVLNNLINAYRHAGDAARVRETAELLRDLRRP